MCSHPLLPVQVCLWVNATDALVWGPQLSPPGSFLVQATTSLCTLQKVACGHCPSFGNMTLKGNQLALMRTSCPARHCSAVQGDGQHHCLLCFHCGA